jgi:hypothetical protein
MEEAVSSVGATPRLYNEDLRQQKIGLRAPELAVEAVRWRS